MINDVSVYVPSAKFKEVLNTYAAGSKRRFQDSIYSRLRDVIIRAYKYTKVAAWGLLQPACRDHGKTASSGFVGTSPPKNRLRIASSRSAIMTLKVRGCLTRRLRAQPTSSLRPF
jgi:hypothetical protein